MICAISRNATEIHYLKSESQVDRLCPVDRLLRCDKSGRGACGKGKSYNRVHAANAMASQLVSTPNGHKSRFR